GGWDRIRRVWSCDAASKTRAGALIAAGVYSGHLDEIDSFGDEADQGNANDGVGRWVRGDEGHRQERGGRAGWIGGPVIDPIGREVGEGVSVSVGRWGVPGGVQDPRPNRGCEEVDRRHHDDR